MAHATAPSLGTYLSRKVQGDYEESGSKALSQDHSSHCVTSYNLHVAN